MKFNNVEQVKNGNKESPEVKAEKMTHYIKSTLELWVRDLKEVNPGGIKGFIVNVTNSRLLEDHPLKKKVFKIITAIGEEMPRDVEQTQSLIQKIDSPDIQNKILTNIEEITSAIKES